MTCPEDCRADGNVARLYVRSDGAYLRLSGLAAENTPGGEQYFVLQTDHPNYNALYSLILVAATNRYRLRVRTSDDIKPAIGNDPGENAIIYYVVVNW